MSGKGRLPGSPRIPGSGRVKGTPNKKTRDLMVIFDQLEYDPARALLDLLPQLELEKQADVHLRLMKFKYPERKAIEIENLSPDDDIMELEDVSTDAIVRRLKALSGGQ